MGQLFSLFIDAPQEDNQPINFGTRISHPLFDPNALSDVFIYSDFMAQVGTSITEGKKSQMTEQLNLLLAIDEVLLHNLLTRKFAFKDHARRIFHNITPLQLAFWNLNIPMFRLLQSYMNQEDVKSQLLEIEEQGITYDIPRDDFDRLIAIAPDSEPPIVLDPDSKELDQKVVTLKEKYYDWGFRVLSTALNNDNDVEWLSVGYAQRTLTSPFIDSYLNPRVNLRPDFSIIKPTSDDVTYYKPPNNPSDFLDNWGESLLTFGRRPSLRTQCAIDLEILTALWESRHLECDYYLAEALNSCATYKI